MFLLKKLIASMNKSLAMGLILVVLGMGGTGAFGAANTQAIEAAVTAYQTIGTLRQATPINGDAIASAYAGALQTLAQEVDTDNNLKLDSDILAAIDEIKSGNEPALASQVVDKTLQRVFYQIVFNRMSAMRSQFPTLTTAELVPMLDEMVAAYQAISGNVARVNQVLSADKLSIVEGSNPAADVSFNESVARIRTALNKTNPQEDAGVLAVERYVTRISSLTRAYYNAVLREVAGAMESRNTDVEEMRKELKEGEIFYRIIESNIARDNPVGSLRIKSRLTGDGSDLVADEIVSDLNLGMLGRSRGEMANIATADSREGRMAEASGTREFAQIFMPDLELRMGATVRDNLQTALNDLNSAVKADDAAKSAQVQAAITAIFDDYEQALNLTAYTPTTDTALVDNAVVGYQAIADALAKDPIDANAIVAAYGGELQQVTQIIGQIYGLPSDQDILAAIESIKNGTQVELAGQTVNRLLQQIFALGIYNRTTMVLDNFDSMSSDQLALEWDRAHSASAALIGVTSGTTKVLTDDKLTIQDGTNPDLDDQVTFALMKGREALAKANVDDRNNVAIARENIIMPLVNGFLKSTLGEVGGLITNRTTDADKAKVDQKEAELLYRTVDVFIAQDNPSGNGVIRTQLTGDVADVVANEIVIEISKGIIGQVRRNISQIESTFAVDMNEAALAAERVVLNVNIFLPDLELRLGSQQRIEMQNALQDLKEAIRTNDASKALVAGSAINEIIAAYEGELN
ncbi:hypothetical protein ABF87_13345 [Nitrosomonas sp. JL21]|uniref:hypothetical protein n=1 Tax=Nitrosomonas sp. JL21 TaxID=153949 RepID=UPI00137135B5|nr:hypothetical protein [Nitrosomonas sp. JL21]MBL8497487.1 hypothetical protein [Nitrosomonas sp.]MXS78921.1 hypothetical protein [Nitrosomonas sp. JL21]